MSRKVGLFAVQQSLSKYQSKEPFFGIDFMMAMYVVIPRLRALHEGHGPTFQARTLLGVSPMMTIAPENSKVICSSKKWGS